MIPHELAQALLGGWTYSIWWQSEQVVRVTAVMDDLLVLGPICRAVIEREGWRKRVSAKVSKH